MECFCFLFIAPDGDSGNHIFRIGAWHQLWQNGVFYPRWLPQALMGFGAPAFYFYPPLVYIVSSGLYVLSSSASPDTIFRFTVFLFDILSLFSFLSYLRSRGFSIWASIFSATLYAFAPYRFLDANIRGAIAEHAAFTFLPFVLYGLDRILLDNRKTNTAFIAIAIGWAGTLFTNIPASGVLFCGMALYAGAQHQSWDSKKLGFVLASVIIGTALAAPVLIPAYSFGGLIRHDMFTQPSYTLGNSNTPLLDIFAGKNLTINLCCIITLLGTLALWSHSRISYSNQDRSLLWLLITVSLVQFPFLSGLLFQYFPPAVLIQFPWRFEILLIPIAGIFFARAIDGEQNRSPWIVTLWSVAIILLIVARGTNITINPHRTDQSDPTWEYMVPQWAPNPDSSSLPFWTSAAAFNHVTTAELNPAENLIPMPTDIFFDSIHCHFLQPHIVSFHRFYWPTWHAQIDGQPASPCIGPNGVFSLAIPSGTHTATLFLTESFSERLGNWIAGIALFGVLALLIIRRK